MKIAVVASRFPTKGGEGNVFVAKRMAELARHDDPYGVRVERLDLMGREFRRLAVRAVGEGFGQSGTTLLLRMLRPRFVRSHVLFVDGARSPVQVLVFRCLEGAAARDEARGSIGRIASAVRRRGCDLVHSHFLWYADIGARIAAELNVPHVVTAHGSDVHQTMRLDGDRRRLFKQILEEADAAIFVSRALLEEAESYGYSGRNAHVVHNGFDPQVFHPPEPASDRREGSRMLFVGNLLEVKGADRLPRIFTLVANDVPNARLDVVGGSLRKGLGRALRSEFERSEYTGAVRFLGPKKPFEVAECMRRSDLVIVPSRGEGFGCVAVEAQACGTPVLGAATGGLPEAIGDPAMTVEEGGDFEAAFAQKAAAVLRSGSRGVRPDIATFTWRAVVQEERRVYRRVLARDSL